MSTRGGQPNGGARARSTTRSTDREPTLTGGQAEQIRQQERTIAALQTRLDAIESEQRIYSTWLARPANRADARLYKASEAYLARLDDAHDDLARDLADFSAALRKMTGTPAPTANRRGRPTSSAAARKRAQAKAQAQIARADRRYKAWREAQSKAATEAALAAQKQARAAARAAKGQTKFVPERDEMGQWKSNSRSETPSEE